MTLWPHQQRAVEIARGRKHLAILYDLGTGKTATTIHILREDFNHSKRIRRTLILAPLSICQQWKAEFAKFSKIPEDQILVLTQTGATRAKLLRRQRDLGKGCVVITNYEGISINAFYQELLNWGPEIMIADEAHRLKNAGSKRAIRIYPLSMASDRRFILTGTLFTNSLLDVYGAYKFLDPTIFGPSFWKFRSLYFYDKNAGMPTHKHFPDWQPHPEAGHRISGIISGTSVQARKEDCLSLPPLVKVTIPHEIKGYQKKCYEMMEREYVAELKGKTVISEFAMTVQLRLRQILAGFLSASSKDEPQYFDENPRIEALADLLESIGREKCIIWCSFAPSYTQIGKLLERMGLAYERLTGEQSAVQKEIALQKFAGDGAQILLSNPSAGGVGINLAHAPFAIYYDKSYSLEHYLQSSARNHRAGSERFTRVTQYSLQAIGTIDEVIEAALENKQDLGQRILDWAREKTLARAKNEGHGTEEGETPCLMKP